MLDKIKERGSDSDSSSVTTSSDEDDYSSEEDERKINLRSEHHINPLAYSKKEGGGNAELNAMGNLEFANIMMQSRGRAGTMTSETEDDREVSSTMPSHTIASHQAVIDMSMATNIESSYHPPLIGQFGDDAPELAAQYEKKLFPTFFFTYII